MICSNKFFSSALLVSFFPLLLASCYEPKVEKPIPALNPSKALKKDALPEPKILEKKTGTVTRIDISDYFQLYQNQAVLTYDVRPAIVYKLGNIPRSISWPKSSFEKELAKHSAAISAANSSNRPVVIYCTDLACPDATWVANQLAEKGLSTSVLDGGYDAWKLITQ